MSFQITKLYSLEVDQYVVQQLGQEERKKTTNIEIFGQKHYEGVSA